MLHWLAGAKAPEGSTDPDVTTTIDVPETPAPVFAVRAFKHAIFGTPQTVQPKPRRHSTTERDRQRPTGTRPIRPQMARPKSTSDAITLAVNHANALEPMPSPTKGILMTPGTAKTRGKTVTFGEHVLDNEGKRSKDGSKSGLPDDCPGKFPSPWVAAADKAEDGATLDERKRSRSKLTEDLHKVREESAAKRRSEGELKQKLSTESPDHPNMEEPTSESGKYWKREYDIYRANTTREVKKLVTKQKAAKSYAREKDVQCTELADELRQERKKVEKLENRTSELEAQLKALQSHLENNRRPSSAEGVVPALARSVVSRDVPSKQASRTMDRSLPQASFTTGPRPADLDEYVAKLTEASDVKALDAKVARSARTRHRPGNLPTDIWTQNLASSSPALQSKPEPQTTAPRGGRAVTSGTNLTPLKSLSINSAPKGRGMSREVPPASPGFDQANVHDARPNTIAAPMGRSAGDESRRDSLSPSRQPLSAAMLTTAASVPSKPVVNTRALPPSPREEDFSPLVPPPSSSPFQPDARPQSISTPTPASAKIPIRPATGRAESKENVSPTRLSAAPASSKAKLDVPRQSTLPADSKPLRDKEGREVSADRLEAAKARLAARKEARQPS